MELRLSTPELLVALRTLGIGSYPALDTPELAKQTPAHIAGMLSAARSSLIARELAAISPENTRTGLALEEDFAGLMAVATVPEASFIVNLRGPDGFRAITVNWTREASCRTWRGIDDVHTFVPTEPQDAAGVTAELVQAIGALGASPSTDDRAVEVPENVVAGLAALAKGDSALRADAVAALSAAGMSSASAASAIGAFAQPERSGGVIVANNGAGTAVDALFWSIREDAGWLIRQTGGRPTATIGPLSDTGLAAALRDAVDRALQGSQPMENYLESVAESAG